MSQLSLVIQNERDNLKALIMEQKRRKIVKALIPILENVNENNLIEFGDFIGELLRYNCDVFVDKGYYPILPKLRKKLTEQQLLDLEYYIMEKYCIGSKEKILTSFPVLVFLHQDKVIGRAYLTNLRLIAIGRLIEKKKSPTAHTHGLISGIISASKDSHRKHLRKLLKQQMEGEDILFFGHQIPIDNPIKIKKTKSNISYTVVLQEEKKKKVKNIRMNFKIIPKKFKKEPGKEFSARKEEVLNIIEGAMQQLT